MRIRPIREDELLLYAQIGTPQKEAEIFAQNLQAMWSVGRSEAASCFVAEEQGQFVGRIVYRKPGSGTQPSRTRIIAAEGWSLPWNGAYLDIGSRLVEGSLEYLKTAGVATVTGKVISRWTQGEQIRAILQEAGLPLEQEKRAFVCNEPQKAVEVPRRLLFKSLLEVGENAFIEVIERALNGSLDQDDQERCAAEGRREIAEEYFHPDQEYFGYEPEWWTFAEDRNGNTVGFVQPAYFKDSDKGELKEGTVVYIGVVPEQRGHGYSVDLLLHATALLQREGVWRILCDTDAQNLPMIEAFQKVGYAPYETVWMYSKKLS